MANCAIKGCGSNQRENKPNVHFHRFPANKKVCERWIELCGNKNTINVQNARLCSLHFGSPDYKRQLKYELLDLPVPKRLKVLKYDALPTRRIPKLEDDPDNATAVSHNKENEPSRLELFPETEARQSLQAMPIQDDPDNATAVSHNKENEPGRLELLHETEARQSLQAMPIQGNPNNAAAAQPVSSRGKDLLGKLCDIIAVQQELEAVKKERDALLKEKEEWSKERIVLRGEVTNVYTKVKYNFSKFFFTISSRASVKWNLY
ncbi:uncharacterized protein LOC143023557 [Oratosquilla oratoria]|uniref:uncharacterized protein LOC143023557 n=1 Tax=Oratosquilla oratoria TaxID=337810 RepID=UPI003F773203